jgi:hypothetical protein
MMTDEVGKHCVVFLKAHGWTLYGIDGESQHPGFGTVAIHPLFPFCEDISTPQLLSDLAHWYGPVWEAYVCMIRTEKEMNQQDKED